MFAPLGVPGRKSAPKKDDARARVIELRREGLSVYEISTRLTRDGTPLGRSAVSDILREEGFGRLLRGPALEVSTSPATSGRDTRPPAESGGVWTVVCPGKQHFANRLDSSRPALGLLHTEEVTGSIPVSPTQLTGQLRSCNWPFWILVQQQSAATRSKSPSRATDRACQALPEWRRFRSRRYRRGHGRRLAAVCGS